MAGPNVYEVGTQVTFRARFGTSPTKLQAKASAGGTTISVFSVSGYAVNDSLIIDHGHPTLEETKIISSISGLTITLTAALSFDHSAYADVAELADPTTVTLKHRTPDDQFATYTYAATTITRDSLGVFSKDLTLTAEGRHWIRWEGTGTVVRARETEVIVQDSRFN